jgi:hypothetical protein
VRGWRCWLGRWVAPRRTAKCRARTAIRGSTAIRTRASTGPKRDRSAMQAIASTARAAAACMEAFSPVRPIVAVVLATTSPLNSAIAATPAARAASRATTATSGAAVASRVAAAALSVAANVHAPAAMNAAKHPASRSVARRKSTPFFRATTTTIPRPASSISARRPRNSARCRHRRRGDFSPCRCVRCSRRSRIPHMPQVMARATVLATAPDTALVRAPANSQ